MIDVQLPDGFIRMLDREDWDEIFEDGGWLNRRHLEKIWRKAGRKSGPPVDRCELKTKTGANIMTVMDGPWPPS